MYLAVHSFPTSGTLNFWNVRYFLINLIAINCVYTKSNGLFEQFQNLFKMNFSEIPKSFSQCTSFETQRSFIMNHFRNSRVFLLCQKDIPKSFYHFRNSKVFLKWIILETFNESDWYCVMYVTFSIKSCTEMITHWLLTLSEAFYLRQNEL